jgi:hypothetical protein
MMETPEIIETKIKELQEQLKESKKYYQYKLLCDSSWSEEMIGFFNIGNTKKILTELHSGGKLQYRHSVFGDVDVYMNSQKNRIIVSENDVINEENIMSYIIWHTGIWYVNNQLISVMSDKF